MLVGALLIPGGAAGALLTAGAHKKGRAGNEGMHLGGLMGGLQKPRPMEKALFTTGEAFRLLCLNHSDCVFAK